MHRELSASLVLALILVPISEARPSTPLEASFVAAGPVQFKGEGTFGFVSPGMAYGLGGHNLPAPVPGPISYSLEVLDATLQLRESTHKELDNPVLTGYVDHAVPVAAPLAEDRMLESWQFSGTIRIIQPEEGHDAAHAIFPPNTNLAPPDRLVQWTAAGPTDLRLSAPSGATSYQSPAKFANRPDGHYFWRGDEGVTLTFASDQTLATKDPIIALLYGGTIVSDGSIVREWETGRFRDQTNSTGVDGLGVPEYHYQYLFLQARGARLTLGQGSEGMLIRTGEMHGAVAGDGIWQSIEGTVNHTGEQRVYSAEAFQTRGTFDLDMEMREQRPSWDLRGDADLVAVDTVPAFGSRDFALGAAGLTITAILALLLAKGLAVLLGKHGSRVADQGALESPTRRAIVKVLLASRALGLPAIATAIGKSETTVRYQLGILVDQGIVTKVQSEKRRHQVYALAGSVPLAADVTEAVAGFPLRTRMFEIIKEHGPIATREIAAHVEAAEGKGHSTNTLSYHLGILVASGSVRTEWSKGRKLFAADARTVEQAHSNRLPALERLGLLPVVRALEKEGPLDAEGLRRSSGRLFQPSIKRLHRDLEALIDLGVVQRGADRYALVGQSGEVRA